VFKVVCLSLCVLGLSACAVPFASSNSHGYLKSRNAPKLVVPPPLQQDEISSFYELPDAEGNKRVSIRP
jgi:uncharacterized lipoprotein